MQGARDVGARDKHDISLDARACTKRGNPRGPVDVPRVLPYIRWEVGWNDEI